MIASLLFAFAGQVADVPNSDDVPVKAASEQVVVPDNFIDYFKRTEQVRVELTRDLKSRITNLTIEHNGASGTRKKVVKKQLTALENSLDELKRSRVTAFLPAQPKIGDIGAIKFGEVVVVIDGKTAVVSFDPRLPDIGNNSPVLAITSFDTKSLKNRQKFKNTELFKVIAVDSKESPLASDNRLKGYSKLEKLLLIVEPVKPSDVGKYRMLYEEKKKK